jgi:hypothetical protein
MCRACSTVGEVIGENEMFVGLPERKRALGRPKCKRDDNVDGIRRKYFMSNIHSFQ